MNEQDRRRVLAESMVAPKTLARWARDPKTVRPASRQRIEAALFKLGLNLLFERKAKS
jgi:hypothetical protein